MISPRFDPEAIPSPCLTAIEAVRRYLQLRLDQGMLVNSDTFRHLRKHLSERFCGAFGEWPIEDIKTDHLRTWVKTLTNPKTSAPMSHNTRNHHLKDLKVFFKCARVEGWIQRDPTEPMKLVKLCEENVTVIPVRDAFEVFKQNRDRRCIGRLALEAFGGLRYSTAGQVVKEDLKFDVHGIEMPSNKHKSRKRKFRQGQPENCWKWLSHSPDGCWALTLRQYAEEKKEMLVIAGVRPLVTKCDEDREKLKTLHNIWRHSFASYLLALRKNFPDVAYLMQHSKTTTTEIYEGQATERDARLYFAISPDTVMMTWEEFVDAHSEPKSGQITQPTPTDER